MSAQALASDQLVLRIGSEASVKSSSQEKLVAKKTQVISISDHGARFVIRGKKLGWTTIAIGSRQIDIAVLSDPQFREYEKLKSLLKNFMGLNFKMVESKAVIYGELLRPSDWQKVSELNTTNLPFRFEAKVANDLQISVRDLILKAIKANHLPPADILFNDLPTLTLPLKSKSLQTSYTQALAPWGIKVAINPAALALNPMIRTSIVVASIFRSKIQALGVDWPSSYVAQILPKFAAPTDGASNSLNFRFLEQRGIGKILASPTLLCLSGKEASFLAGGEFPIKILNFKQKDVIWKKYGVLLRVKPEADFSGKMSINLETEVSAIDESQKIDGIPALHTNRMNSHFDLTESKTIALSGLIQDDFSRSFQGLPFIQRLPVLGTLFSSEDFRQRKTELVIFVTPKIVFPNDNLNENELPKGWQDDSP